MDKKNLHHVSSILPLYILAIALLILSLACSLPGSAATAAPAAGEVSAATVELPEDRGPAPTPVQTGPVSIGDPFLICDTAVTVLGWETVAPGEFFTPKAGNRFIAVEVVLVNLGKTPIETTWFTFTLLDAYDEIVPDGIFPVILAHGTALNGGLAPGERVRAKVGFESLEEEQKFSLEAKCFNFENNQNGELIVELGSKPQSVQAPGNFEGEILNDPLALGKSAMVNSVEITVNKVSPFPEKYFDPSSNPRVSPPMSWMKYIIVDLTLVNKGTDEVELFRTGDLYARDLEGRRYITIGWTNQVLDEEIEDFITLKPGDELTGQVTLQIPKDSGHMYFVFEYGYGQAGQRVYFLLI